MPKKYIIGTRGSLLALTQCTQIKEKLVELTGDEFSLEIIKTEGDENTTLPLWQLDGKDFFTKELDAALLTKKVDLVVHSYKDLGSERPKGIQLAAVTERCYPEDIILFRKDFLKNCSQKESIIVGTSSPRRMINLSSTLGEYLPGHKNIETKNLRGNVNTRIQKLVDGEFDIICLALAGLERLANSEKSLKVLKDLTKNLSFMILPPSVFPPAASQGALGIECLSQRSDNTELLKKLKEVHHDDTFDEIKREREAFASYGGGCHLAVGIHVKKWNDLYIHTHKGKVDDKKILIQQIEQSEKSNIHETEELNLLLQKNSYADVFIGTTRERNTVPYLTDKIITKDLIEVDKNSLQSSSNLYITSKHCEEGLISLLSTQSDKIKGIFASGSTTMKGLLQKGIAVQFCADSHGDQEIKRYLKSKVVQLLLGLDQSTQTLILTNDLSTSPLGKTCPCYTRNVDLQILEGLRAEIESKNLFYWSSFFQYEKYLELIPSLKNKYHLCGFGKTFKEFSKREIKVFPMELCQFINELK
ncbi:MAG: hydroxymethylbilane synthase [Bacteriovoracaceae bacterium]|nr:hydroxymethylbilane synthase [Bacteriovoracaceae bacterium]